MSSADQVARLLALVPYLQQHPDADLRQTAALFRVTPKQLVADLNVLWYCGLPGGMPGDLIEVDMDAVAEQGRIRLTNADYLTRPLRFTLDEAMSLAVALRALLELGDAALASSVRSALAKLEAVVGEEGPRVGVRLAGGEEAVRAGLVTAIESGVGVRLTYHGASRDATTTPLVDPARVVVRDGVGYLDAYSQDRGAWRTYRLDRIVGVEATAEPRGDHGAPPEVDGGWLDHRPDAAEVVVDVAPDARWITEYHPVRAVIPAPDGGARITLLVADPAWFRRLLLRLGPAVRAVDPPEAARSAGEEARAALALYG